MISTTKCVPAWKLRKPYDWTYPSDFLFSHSSRDGRKNRVVKTAWKETYPSNPNLLVPTTEQHYHEIKSFLKYIASLISSTSIFKRCLKLNPFDFLAAHKCMIKKVVCQNFMPFAYFKFQQKGSKHKILFSLLFI